MIQTDHVWGFCFFLFFICSLCKALSASLMPLFCPPLLFLQLFEDGDGSVYHESWLHMCCVCNESWLVQCRFTSTETIRTVRDADPRQCPSRDKSKRTSIHCAVCTIRLSAVFAELFPFAQWSCFEHDWMRQAPFEQWTVIWLMNYLCKLSRKSGL